MVISRIGGRVDLDEIFCLCDNINLDEKDKLVVRVRQTDLSKSKERLDICPMEKILGNKATDKEGLEKVVSIMRQVPSKIHVE